jgi:hypothetical protein
MARAALPGPMRRCFWPKGAEQNDTPHTLASRGRRHTGLSRRMRYAPGTAR